MAIDFMGMLPSIIEGFQGLTLAGQGGDIAEAGAKYAANSFRVAGSLGITGAQYKADTLRRAADMAQQGADYENKVIQTAKKVSTEGYKYQSDTLVAAGQTAVATSIYNKQLDELESDRLFDAMGRQIKSSFSTNQNIMAGSGVSMNSKSYLVAMDSALSTYESQTKQFRNSTKLRQQQILREGHITGVQYQNEANSVIYQGQIASYNFDRQMEANKYQADIASYNYNNQAVAAEFEGQVEAYHYESQARQAEYQGKVAQYQAGVSQANAIGGMVGKLGSLF